MPCDCVSAKILPHPTQIPHYLTAASGRAEVGTEGIQLQPRTTRLRGRKRLNKSTSVEGAFHRTSAQDKSSASPSVSLLHLELTWKLRTKLVFLCYFGRSLLCYVGLSYSTRALDLFDFCSVCAWGVCEAKSRIPGGFLKTK